MKMTLTPEQIMESEADFGLFYARIKIGLNKGNSLREQGLEVTDMKEVNYYPRYHYISWKHALVECENVNLLDEKSDEYTLAQKLWIIAMKNQPNCLKN